MKLNPLYFIGMCVVFFRRAFKKAASYYLSERLNRVVSRSSGKVVFNGIGFVSSPKNFFVGNNVHVGDNSYIRAEGGLYIGDNTHISRNCVIYTINHNYGGRRLPYDDTNIEKSVWIGRNVWIGMNVVILPGSVIEDGAIVGAGVVVHGVVGKLEVVVNASMKAVSSRDAAHYERLDAACAYGGINGREVS